jgi:hypothetical protein
MLSAFMCIVVHTPAARQRPLSNQLYYQLLLENNDRCHAIPATVEVEVTLQLTVSDGLGVGHPFGAHDQILLFPFFCRKIALFFVFGRPF